MSVPVTAGGNGTFAPVDVLLVSLGTTAGWRASDDAFAGALRRAGAEVEHVTAAPVRDVRTFVLTDLAQARATRRAAAAAIRRDRPRAIVYSSTTAALLWPAPGAIRFDSPAAVNRPGRHGLWQRPVERRRLAAAPVLVPFTAGGLAEAGVGAERAVVVPMPVVASGPPGARDLAAVTYGANPEKKGLARVLAAWRAARRPGETLVVAGLDGPGEDGIRYAGRLAPDAFRALLRRARVFLAAPVREDYGVAPLEALADGCALVSAPAPGPYAALPLARELDPRLVADDLARAVRAALDDPVPGYAARAAALLEPYSPAAVDRVVGQILLPRLLGTPGEANTS